MGGDEREEGKSSSHFTAAKAKQSSIKNTQKTHSNYLHIILYFIQYYSGAM